jgi:hypothetical protein
LGDGASRRGLLLLAASGKRDGQKNGNQQRAFHFSAVLE